MRHAVYLFVDCSRRACQCHSQQTRTTPQTIIPIPIIAVEKTIAAMPTATARSAGGSAAAPSRSKAAAAAAPSRLKPTPSSSSSTTSTSSSVLANLPEHLAQAFAQAQSSLAVHRKLFATLFTRAHAPAAGVVQETARGTKLVGEKAFNDAFLGCLNRVLAVRRGESVGDRCIKFAAGYAAFATAKFREEARLERSAEEEEEEEEEEDTTATRFVEILLKHLLRGFIAKNKAVRLRCCQLVALLVNGLESIE